MKANKMSLIARFVKFHEDNGIENYATDLWKEYNYINERVNSANKFMHSSLFTTLTIDEQELMEIQYKAMSTYAKSLYRRFCIIVDREFKDRR